MKKIILALLFVSSALFSFAQDTQEIYCEVVGKATLSLTGKIKIDIDFGQQNQVFEGINHDALKDPVTGKPMKFNSMIDALNFMAGDGWVFVNAYNISDNNGNTQYHYIMRKVVPKQK